MKGNDNVLMLTDSYKITHWTQYPEHTDFVYSYLESRGGKFEQTVFFGLQYFLKEYLSGVVVTKEFIDEAEEICLLHFGQNYFNREGWEYILKEYEGKLPVSICAVEEGSIHPVSTPLITMENTDPKVPWLTNYLETLIVEVWYPITVATQSYFMKQNILKYLELTGTPEDILFKLHDFGFRGVSSPETASIGGASHLVNFMGTDTLAAITMIRRNYNNPCAGNSIAASEHSTITSWGKYNEVEAFKNMLKQYPTGIIACVSDSYDIFKACKKLWGEILHDDIMNRDGTLVIRPDSGNPVDVILRCLDILEDKFGCIINTKGFKVLDSHVRIIQGDGIDAEMIDKILSAMYKKSWSADNIAFGSGGALLQKLNRDTNSFAFKCSNITINGIDSKVFKDPITASNKVSKGGKFNLPEIFRNGKLLREYTFDEIRERINNDR